MNTFEKEKKCENKSKSIESIVKDVVALSTADLAKRKNQVINAYGPSSTRMNMIAFD